LRSFIQRYTVPIIFYAKNGEADKIMVEAAQLRLKRSSLIIKDLKPGKQK
jgi:hypothetical protein